MQREIWKDIKGYEGRYKISSFGRVKSFYKHNDNYRRIYDTKITIMKLILSTPGYYKICLCKNNIHNVIQLHRLVATHFINNPKNKPCVNHKNGIKTDNRVSNLEWCTDSENKLHAYATGLRRHRIGEDATNVKLKEKDVLFIRRNIHLKPDYLAKKYNINPRYVDAIRHGDYWKNIC